MYGRSRLRYSSYSALKRQLKSEKKIKEKAEKLAANPISTTPTVCNNCLAKPVHTKGLTSRTMYM